MRCTNDVLVCTTLLHVCHAHRSVSKFFRPLLLTCTIGPGLRQLQKGEFQAGPGLLCPFRHLSGAGLNESFGKRRGINWALGDILRITNLFVL